MISLDLKYLQWSTCLVKLAVTPPPRSNVLKKVRCHRNSGDVIDPCGRRLLLDKNAEVPGALANNNRDSVPTVIDVSVSPGGFLGRHGCTAPAQSHPAPPADGAGARAARPGGGVLLWVLSVPLNVSIPALFTCEGASLVCQLRPYTRDEDRSVPRHRAGVWTRLLTSAWSDWVSCNSNFSSRLMVPSGHAIRVGFFSLWGGREFLGLVWRVFGLQLSWCQRSAPRPYVHTLTVCELRHLMSE